MESDHTGLPGPPAQAKVLLFGYSGVMYLHRSL